ncbi:unnamed protein product [Mycena citricolor]|uniref:Peptidase M13 N-terminal domain-containing protein n=1 Tax=Mycena citricolor TaxID=2018698 RepID=A0AAD2HSN1_9AGAR|nr:unnamed protein product [Mycena citricolor]
MTDRYSDQEAAPLLRNDDEDAGSESEPSPTFAERVSALAQEPLTPLNQVLLVLALVLLLLCSVFLGLFLGEYTKLQRHVDEPQSTLTVTATSTQTVTATASPPGPTSPPAEAVCLTPACIELSAAIMSSMDQSQDPCEDFFRFTGGGWISAHPLPADKGSVGQFESLGQANKRILQDLLERPGATAAFTSTDDEKLLQKLRGFYDSCLNENLLDDLGTAPLIHFAKTLQSLYRGDSLETTQDGLKKNGLTAALAFLHTRGITSFFAFEIEGDVGVDPNFMVPQFDQADLGLPSKEYYEEESIVEVYQGVVERLLFTLSEEEEKLQALRSSVLVENAPWPSWPWPPWDDEPEEKKPNRSDIAHQMAKKVIAFETKIANASLDGDLYQDPFFVYNRVPLSNLSESLPQVNFNEYFATFTPRNFPENVVVASPKYASDLSEILAATDSEVIESYLIVRAALNLAPNLGMATEAWQAQRTLLETLTGIKKGAVGDRAEYCIGKLEGALGFAAGRYFVNETFGGDSQEKAAKIITDIIESFKESLPNVSWLDEPSAEAAAEKVSLILPYLQNHHSPVRHRLMLSRSRLGTPPIRTP